MTPGDPTPTEPAIPQEEPPIDPPPEIDPGSTPQEMPPIDPPAPGPGDWRPHDRS